MLPEKRNAALHRKVFRKNTTRRCGDFSTKTVGLTLQCRKAANYFCSKKVVRNETEGEYQVEVLEL